MFKKWLKAVFAESEHTPLALSEIRVAAEATRCIQCGCCGYHCPVGIDVRSYARQGLPVTDGTCITCGNCINICPRGTLRWEAKPDA